MIYAGFWKRAVAFIIDGFVLSIPIILLSSLVLGSTVFSAVQALTATTEPSPDVVMGLFGKYIFGGIAIQIGSVVLLWLYHALMESSKYQATLGKMALGIKVVGEHGERISFARATGRTFAKFISHFPFYFGDYMAGFTKHRQALHDLIVSTYVVNKEYQQGQELSAVGFSIGGMIAGILAACAPIALYIGVILMAMFLAVSEVGNTSSDLDDMLSKARRETSLSSAYMKLTLLDLDNQTLAAPLEENGITYSQTPEGYTAAFKDATGNEYELLKRTGEAGICCLKGPNGKCTDNKNLPYYDPCN